MKLYDKVEINECCHVLENHVNLDDQDMIDRLIRGDMDNNFQYFGDRRDLATKFLSKEIAENAIYETIVKNDDSIKRWLEFRTEKRIIVSRDFKTQIGYGYAKNTPFSNKYAMYNCIVVLKLGYNGDLFEIVTAYPAPNYDMSKKIAEDRAHFRNNRKKKHNKS